jgi:hypothetical protein
MLVEERYNQTFQALIHRSSKGVSQEVDTR